jgi:hypothetical protein
MPKGAEKAVFPPVIFTDDALPLGAVPPPPVPVVPEPLPPGLEPLPPHAIRPNPMKHNNRKAANASFRIVPIREIVCCIFISSKIDSSSCRKAVHLKLDG